MSHQHGLDAALSHDRELDSEPFHVFVARLMLVGASVHAGVGVEEVPVVALRTVSTMCASMR